ncbi:uncharacterized protein [Magallana gigas]|uniref:uncharacterized protein n=1 Tax=Magallana gigas TaxID=29159 RepID=UPI0033426DE0
MNNWPIPLCTKDVERFCGFANYHRNFIKDFAEMIAPLYAVTGKNMFNWGDEQQSVFDKVKLALTSAPVLTLPTKEGHFILDTDASEFALGAELLQIQDGQERTISYASIALLPEQKRYCTIRKELLAVVTFTRYYRYYLLGRPFTIRTDHSSLQWLLNFRYPEGQLARWMEELSQYNMKIQYREGKKHLNADALSRIKYDNECPFYRADFKLQDLACGGCHYSAKALWINKELFTLDEQGMLWKTEETDQGTNFTSELFTKMCKMLKIHKTRTTPFRASANGQVERFNRTLMDAVRCYVSKTPREWDVYIPQIAEALRSSVNRSTGYTPNMLMLGRETTQPVDLVFPGQREEQPQDEYLANLTNSITTAHETARDVLKTTHNYDLRTLEHSFKVGYAVYVLDTATVKVEEKCIMYRRSTIRQEKGEHYLDFVRRKTSLRSLVDPRTFVYDLGLLSDETSHATIWEVLKGQYRLAKDLGDSRWIETTRRETVTILCSDR